VERIERIDGRLSDDELRRRICVIDKQLKRWQRRNTVKRIGVYLAIAAFCVVCWGGAIYVAERLSR
jgi:hypothetical protein